MEALTWVISIAALVIAAGALVVAVKAARR